MFELSGVTEKTVLHTVIVIDHGSSISVLDSIRMDASDGVASSSSKHKSSSHSNSIGFLSKNVWTIMVEGAVEYCRIIYDLLPEEYMVISYNVALKFYLLLLFHKS